MPRVYRVASLIPVSVLLLAAPGGSVVGGSTYCSCTRTPGRYAGRATATSRPGALTRPRRTSHGAEPNAAYGHGAGGDADGRHGEPSQPDRGRRLLVSRRRGSRLR